MAQFAPFPAEQVTETYSAIDHQFSSPSFILALSIDPTKLTS
jgi:hypothetical protein